MYVDFLRVVKDVYDEAVHYWNLRTSKLMEK